jgi:putative transposase
MPQARDQRGKLLQLESQVRGLEVSEAKRLRRLESDKLKKLLADAMLDNGALKDLLAKKNGDARCQARGCRSCTFGVRVERAAGAG